MNEKIIVTATSIMAPRSFWVREIAAGLLRVPKNIDETTAPKHAEKMLHRLAGHAGYRGALVARPCLNCGRLIGGGSRCADCERRAYSGSILTPSSSRWAWSRLRAGVLAAEPWCRACRIHPAVTVDHVLQRVDGGSDHPSNLVPLCDDCHQGRHRNHGDKGGNSGTYSGAATWNPRPTGAQFMNLALKPEPVSGSGKP